MLLKGVDLKWFRKNPVVLYGHSYGSLPIGRAAWVRKDNGQLKAKTIFASEEANPVAEQVYNLFKEKILKAWSVSFIVLESREAHEDEFDVPVRRVITKWALLEYSAVPVPSNMEALTTAIGKGLTLDNDMKLDMGFTVETSPGVWERRKGTPHAPGARNVGEKEDAVVDDVYCPDALKEDGDDDAAEVIDPDDVAHLYKEPDEPTIAEQVAELDVRMQAIEEEVHKRVGDEERARIEPTLTVLPSAPAPAPPTIIIPPDFAKAVGAAVKEGLISGVSEAAGRSVDKAVGRVKEL